jgi:hypothetical protein
MLTYIGRDYQKSLKEKQPVTYQALGDRESTGSSLCQRSLSLPPAADADADADADAAATTASAAAAASALLPPPPRPLSEVPPPSLSSKAVVRIHCQPPLSVIAAFAFRGRSPQHRNRFFHSHPCFSASSAAFGIPPER